MRSRFRSLAWLRLLLLAGVAVAPVSMLRAQDPGELSAETRSVLGPPQAADSGADFLAVLGRPEGPALSESIANERAKEVAEKLRCPVCQGVSIADSPSGMAANMRGQVRDLLSRGYSEEQAMNYFERSYGEFVRLEPPLRGLNVMLWILPGAVLIGGAWFVFRKASTKPPLSVAEAGPQVPKAGDVDPELAKYLERIRRDSGTAS